MITLRRTIAVLAAVLAAGPLLLVAAAPMPAFGGGDAEVLRRAQQAAGTTSFEATVVVRWVGTDGVTHQSDLPVRGGGGRVVLGASADPVQRKAERKGGADAGGITWSAGAVGSSAPDPTAKYDVEVGDGPTVLARRTRTVRLSLAGRVREAADVDVETGLLLRREMFDPSGATVRTVELTALRLLGEQPVPGSLGVRSDAMGHLPDDVAAPDRLGAGYRRLDAYRRGDGVQVLYGDGLHTLSVFTYPGPLQPSALPPGGEELDVGGHGGHRWTWAGGQVVTWSRAGQSITVVGDGPLEEVVGAARQLPSARSASVGDRVRTRCRTLVELVT